MFATLAKQERARISERTIAGLKVARAKGRVLGRPPLAEETIQRVLLLNRHAGIGARKIAKSTGFPLGHSQCNLDQIPTTDLLSTDAWQPMRIFLRKQGRRHPTDPGLSRAQEHHAYCALHKTCTWSIHRTVLKYESGSPEPGITFEKNIVLRHERHCGLFERLKDSVIGFPVQRKRGGLMEPHTVPAIHSGFDSLVFNSSPVV
jgi:hypothetical protein